MCRTGVCNFRSVIQGRSLIRYKHVKEARARIFWDYRGREFQAHGKGNRNTLRLERVWRVLGSARRLIRLRQSERNDDRR